jgi:hypothetical protein
VQTGRQASVDSESKTTDQDTAGERIRLRAQRLRRDKEGKRPWLKIGLVMSIKSDTFQT